MNTPIPEQHKVYQLTIQTPTKQLSIQTTDPEDVIRMMQHSGQKVVSHEIILVPVDLAGMEDIEDEECGCMDDDEVEIEEEFANTPAQTKERKPRIHGDITDFGAPGTGHGQKDSANNKPYGSGDNPLTFESVKESFEKFKKG